MIYHLTWSRDKSLEAYYVVYNISKNEYIPPLYKKTKKKQLKTVKHEFYQK